MQQSNDKDLVLQNCKILDYFLYKTRKEDKEEIK